MNYLRTVCVGWLLLWPSRSDSTWCRDEPTHIASFTQEGQDPRWPSLGSVVAQNDEEGIELRFWLGSGDNGGQFLLVVPE